MEDFFDGRWLTSCFVTGLGVFSLSINVWGASLIYSGLAGLLVAGCVLWLEGLAIVSLTHIITDYTNNNFLKSGLGAVAFVGIVVICAMSGKQAFHNLTLDRVMQNEAALARVERQQVIANDYFAAAKNLTGDAKSRENGFGERMQTKVDNLKREVSKKQPWPEWVVVLMLVVFELVKSTGRYALAVESSRKWTLKRRRTEAIKEKTALAKAKAEASNVLNMKPAA